MTPESKHELLVQTATATPSILVLYARKVVDIPLADWGHVGALGFLLLQAAYLIWRWHARVVDRRRAAAGLPASPTDADSKKGDL